MKGLDILETKQWSLIPIFGFEHPFLTLNTETLIYTWILLGILVLLLIPLNLLLRYSRIGRYVIISFIDFFIQLTKQSLQSFSFQHFSFVTSIFCFILLCNLAPLIPWLDEPTKDLNTTLALGLIAFFYTQIVTIQHQGFVSYIKDYFSPFFIMFPLNVVGKIASVVSISFRLFGNIFGGSIITAIWFNSIRGIWWMETIGIISGINLIMIAFFTIFAGFLQAFVFAMLTLTYLSIGLQSEGH